MITGKWFTPAKVRVFRVKMTKKPASLLDRLAQRHALARWSRAARIAEALNFSDLRMLRAEARALRRELNRLLHLAEGRLAQPLPGHDGIARPLGTEWAWRGDLWSGPVHPAGLVPAVNRATLGGHATLFHDCPAAELVLRQIRRADPDQVAAFSLGLDVFRFDGSFLSLAIDLPEAAVRGLRRDHLIRLDLPVEMERPLEIYCRLNVKHGPNTEHLVRTLPHRQGETSVEFDLAYTKLNEKRVERAWIDLVFDGPQMNRIVIHDLTVSRRPRAGI